MRPKNSAILAQVPLALLEAANALATSSQANALQKCANEYGLNLTVDVRFSQEVGGSRIVCEVIFAARHYGSDSDVQF